MSLVNVRDLRCVVCELGSYSETTFAELNQLTGIAAILTFPLDVEIVEAEEREAKEEEERKKLEEDQMQD